MKLTLNELTEHPLFSQRDSTYVRWYPKSLRPALGDVHFITHQQTTDGIYIHVPFCDRLCTFCPFNKRLSDEALISEYVRALIDEVGLYGDALSRSHLKFVYFGGGSPSVLNENQLGVILSALHQNFVITNDTEICMEAHPTHLQRTYARSLRHLGFNRLSTGIQSLDDGRLALLGARHNSADALQAIEAIRGEFGSVAIDLLFRHEGQSTYDWEQQLRRVLEIDAIDHLSCYSLVLANDSKLPTPVQEAEMTVKMIDMLGDAGFAHYASCASGGFDFARPNRMSKYEVLHWGAPQASFLGLGPGGIGFVADSVTMNGLSVTGYIAKLAKGRLPLASVYESSEQELQHRYFVLGVKTLSVPLEPFRVRFNCDPLDVFRQPIEHLCESGFAAVIAESLTLTALGRVFVDYVSGCFFSQSEVGVPHPEEPEIRQAELLSDRFRVNEHVMLPIAL